MKKSELRKMIKEEMLKEAKLDDPNKIIDKVIVNLSPVSVRLLSNRWPAYKNDFNKIADLMGRAGTMLMITREKLNKK